MKFDKITIGAIFCHVVSKKQLYQFIFSIISGTHIWNGDIPILIKILIVIIVVIVSLIITGDIIINGHNKILINNTIDPNVCTKKYIMQASDLKLFFLLEIIGINDIKLISNPIHADNQLLDLITIIVLVIIIIKNNILLEFFTIKKKKINASIFRV
jgi:hypothetical protein